MIEKIKSREEFARVINDRSYKVGLEIGVRHGGYSLHLLENSRLDILYSIDVWLVSYAGNYNRTLTKCMDGANVLKAAVLALEKHSQRSVIIRSDAQKICPLFADGYFDFIHIDGAHKYQYITKDMEMFWPKMKAGGLFSGHDYCRRHANGPYQAANEFAEKHGLELGVTADRRYPSWYFEKP